MGDFGQGMRALAKNATSRASRLASAVESSLATRSHSPVGGPGGFGIGVPHVPSLSSAPLSSRDLITPGQSIVGRTLSVNHSLYAVDRLLASGGFAEVYLVRNTATQQTLALKKVFTAEKETTDAIRSEIQLMQLFRGHPRFVQLVDSEVSTSPNGAIFLILMEYCPGQLISYLNHRINSRLGEPEVLRIFSDVCEAVAHMHYQSPPVIHRDLKIENVLLGPDGEIKLCDFGSATTKVLMIANIRDVPHYEAEIQKFTTLAFRAPEMVDLYQKKVIGEKADIWALGCLLYGICYYQSPFENTGQLAILGGQYDVPSTPPYSQDLKDLIQFMLEVDPDRRPNIYQVLERTSRIRRVPCPIQNIYPREDPTQLQVQAPEPSYAPQSGSAAGDSPQHARGQPHTFSQPKREIVPMRRGRQRQSDPQHSEAPSPQHPPYQHPAPSTQVPDLNAAFGGPFGPASGQSTGALFDEAFGPASAQGSTQDPFSSAFDDTFGPGAGRAPTARPPSGGLFDDPFGSEVPGVTVAQAPQLAPSAFDDAFGSDPFAPSSPAPAPAPAPAPQARTTSSAFEDAFGSSAQTSLPAPDTPPLPSKAPFGNHLRPISRLGSSDSERQGPESPFLPSPTTPLIAQIEGLHIQAKPTTRKRRPHLSQYRAAWVHRAVAKRVALKPNVRRTVGEVWKAANTSEESCTAWLFAEVGKNISPLDPAANLSALYLLHRVMLEGPRKALDEISQSKIPFFENMRTNFIGQTSREKTYSKKIAVYAKFLTQKLKFHKAHPEFEGTFSLQHFFYDFHRLPREQRGLPFFSPTVVRELMDLFLDLEELKDNMLDSRSGSDQLFFLIAGCLAEEFFAIVTIILHLLSKMKENQQYTQETTGLQGKLTRVHQSLTNFYQAVSEFSSGSLIPLPPVPELPPILAEGRRYDYPQSTGMKHLGRLAQRGVSVASFPEAKIYLPLLKEPKDDTSWMPFCSSRYDSAISSESEAELGA